MENVLPNKSNCRIFDLKGSTVDRYISGFDPENLPCGVVFKDLNFEKYDKKILIDNPDQIIQDLLNDMKILRNCKLMDYSMILGIYNYNIDTKYSIGFNYSIAIIDFFQKYGVDKSLERTWKRYILRKNKGISSISSCRYYKRIKKYLYTIIPNTKINYTNSCLIP